jgi:glutathione S-transferase
MDQLRPSIAQTYTVEAPLVSSNDYAHGERADEQAQPSINPTLAMQASTLTPHAGPTLPGTQLPRLYTFRRCPYAIRARMALLQAERAFEAVEVSLRDKPASLLAISPKATVPVLQLPDGSVIEESWDILRWALAEPDTQGWWSRAQSPANLDLVQRNDGDFKHHLDRWKYPQRYAGGALVPDAHRDRAMQVLLHLLEARLQSAPSLGGATPCATDLAVMPFVRQFASVDPGWFSTQNLPAVRAWLNGWLLSPLFATCMSKLPTQGATRFPSLLCEPRCRSERHG